jgi:hypothetical protein
MQINLNTFPKSIADSYFLANTSTYLYDMYKGNDYVQYLSSLELKDLTDTFTNGTKNEINSTEEMGAMYATLVAICLKEGEGVVDFLSSVKENIKYEWFADIANIGLSKKHVSTIYQSVDQPVTISKEKIIISTEDYEINYQ